VTAQVTGPESLLLITRAVNTCAPWTSTGPPAAPSAGVITKRGSVSESLQAETNPTAHIAANKPERIHASLSKRDERVTEL
jgi:hypothetical protein